MMFKNFSVMFFLGLIAVVHAGKRPLHRENEEDSDDKKPGFSEKKTIKKKEKTHNNKEDDVKKYLEQKKYLKTLRMQSLQDQEGTSWNALQDLSLSIRHSKMPLVESMPVTSSEDLKKYLSNLIISNDHDEAFGQKLFTENAVKLVAEYVAANKDNAHLVRQEDPSEEIGFGLIHDGEHEKIIGAKTLQDFMTEKVQQPVTFVSYAQLAAYVKEYKLPASYTFTHGETCFYPAMFKLSGETTQRSEQKVMHQIEKMEL